MSGEISRQAFVRRALGGVVGAALLGSCRSVLPEASSQGPDWNALDGMVDGRVVLPSAPDFAAAKGVFNTRFAGSAPLAVVSVTSEADVQKAMGFAGQNGLGVSARSGGHSYIGASTADGVMVIDLRQLPGGTTLDPISGLVTISPAADLDSAQTILAAQGRSIPSGSCPTVGVAGLALGGGLGSDARSAGLTCDALVSASVVLPSGDVVTASAGDHDDLFWALRGGGGGNCGVVTSLTFRTFPTTDRDVVTLGYPPASAAQVIAGWHNWLSAADRAVWGMVNVTVGGGPSRCTVILATPPGTGQGLAGALNAAVGVAPSSTSIRTKNRLDFIHYFEGGAQARVPRQFTAGSDVIGEMNAAAANSIIAATSAWPTAAGSATAVIESLSGAVNDVAPADSAFPWRQSAASVQWYTEAPFDVASTWLADAHTAVAASSVGGYINYVEPRQPLSRYLGPNLGRFDAVRQAYDAGGLMRSGIA